MEKINKNVIRYKCSICSKEFHLASDAKNCEKTHTCKHTNLKYIFAEAVPDDIGIFNTDELIEKCEDCEKILREISLSNIADNNELLKKVFNFIITNQ